MSEPPAAPIGDSFGVKFLYGATRWTSAIGLTLGFSMRVEGRHNVPLDGPLLAIANHQSFLDPPGIGGASPRRLVYLARKTLFKNRFFAGLIRGLNAVPIDQDGIGKEGLKAILGQLELGKAVLVFPEGSRCPDGKIDDLRPGIHLLIKRTKAPILPIGLAGFYDAWPIWRKYPIPSPLFLPPTARTVAISFGKPLDPAPFAAMPRDAAMAALKQELIALHARAERLRRK